MKLINQPYLPSAENGELFIASGRIHPGPSRYTFPLVGDVHAADGVQAGWTLPEPEEPMIAVNSPFFDSE